MVRNRSTALRLGLALVLAASAFGPGTASADECQTFEPPPSTVNPKTLVVCAPEEGYYGETGRISVFVKDAATGEPVETGVVDVGMETWGVEWVCDEDTGYCSPFYWDAYAPLTCTSSPSSPYPGFATCLLSADSNPATFSFESLSGNYCPGEWCAAVGSLPLVVSYQDGLGWAIGQRTMRFVRRPQVDRYAALGDSYSSGEGLGAYEQRSLGGASWEDHPCHRSEKAYSQLLELPGQSRPFSEEVRLHPDDAFLDFVACSGAETENVTASSDGGADFRGEPPQVDQLHLSDYDLATLTIGGNDIKILDSDLGSWPAVMASCAVLDCSLPPINAIVLGTIMNRRDDVEQAIRSTKEQLASGSPGAEVPPIFLLGYPQLFPQLPFVPCAGLLPWLSGLQFPGTLPAELATIRSWVDFMNTNLAIAAANEGVFFVPVDSQFDGHEVCGTKHDGQYINGIAGDLSPDLDPGQFGNGFLGTYFFGPLPLVDDFFGFDLPFGSPADMIGAFVDFTQDPATFHPNAAGHEAYARALREFIQERLAGGLPRTSAGLPSNPCASWPGGCLGSGASSVMSSVQESQSSALSMSDPGASSTSASSSPDPSFGFLYALPTQLPACAPAQQFVPGRSIRAVAEGFAPGTQASVQFELGPGSAVELAPATVTDTGHVDLLTQIPVAARAPGQVILRATGTGAEGEPRTAVTMLGVQRAAAPCTEADALAASAGLELPVDVLANDDAGASLLAASTLAIARAPASGRAAVDTTTGRILYTASPGFEGSDSFRYGICTVAGGCGVEDVEITVSADCTITGTEGDDVLVGTEGDDAICGLGGNDEIQGLGGNDRLSGGSGDDRIDGGPGDDALAGDYGGDTLDGGAGNDWLEGGHGTDLLRGGADNDLLDGGEDDDVLQGGDGDDRIHGGGGADLVEGNGGDDDLLGGDGQDHLWGGDGSDDLRGGADADTLHGGTSDDALRGGEGDDVLLGDDGNDLSIGGFGVDTLDGGAGANTLRDDACGNGWQEHVETCDDGNLLSGDGCSDSCEVEGIACSDGIDGDGDGLADWPADPGCPDAEGVSERGLLLACDDGQDQDEDGLIDFPHDPGCASATASREDPACDNGRDDDGDGLVDLADAGCGGRASRASETPPRRGCGLLGAEGLLALLALRSRRAGKRPS